MSEPSESGNQDPGAEYSRRLEKWRRVSDHSACLDRQVSHARFAVFLSGIFSAWFVFVAGVLAPGWLAMPVGLFVFLVFAHQRVIRSHRRAERGVEFYQSGMARLEDAWVGKGEPGTRFLEEDHPYAGDLDLFGRGSLFELLCTVRTGAGENILASWLRRSGRIREIRERQSAVAELRPRLDLREDLALLGAEVRAAIDPEALAAWGKAPGLLNSRTARITAVALVLLTLAAFSGWIWIGIGYRPLILALLLEGIFGLSLRFRVGRVVTAVERPGRDLELLSQILARLERERFRSPRLMGLRRALDTDGIPPSRRIRRLGRWIELLDSRRNQLFAPVAVLLLWTTQVAFAIEAWRAMTGSAVAGWLDAVGEFEALCALAGHAFEHPEDPFPEVVSEGPCFEGEGLGHPLLPEGRCVRNDLRLGREPQLLVVSGSNMSGKSTLLRTVGTNAVLALAGATVRARRLRLSPLVLGASIRILDSLREGSSRFYAEITRLRRLVELTEGDLPLLFLLDEILHGTNSHDRRIGAEGIVRSFLERGGIGLVTTHDLALAEIADSFAPRAANIHFEDHIKDGRIAFDFRIRPGVVKKSNALELMRSVGLDV